MSSNEYDDIEDYYVCSRCGEPYYYYELTEMEDGSCLCPDCYEEVLEEENQE